MREHPWHLRRPSTAHYRKFRRLLDLHAITRHWIRDIDPETYGDYQLERLPATAAHKKLSKLTALIQSTDAEDLDGLLVDSYPDEMLPRLEHTVWAIQGWTLRSMLERQSAGDAARVLSVLGQSAWISGRRAAREHGLGPGGTDGLARMGTRTGSPRPRAASPSSAAAGKTPSRGRLASRRKSQRPRVAPEGFLEGAFNAVAAAARRRLTAARLMFMRSATRERHANFGARALEAPEDFLGVSDLLLVPPALRDLPLSGSSDTPALVLRRATHDLLDVELGICPHRLPYPETQSVADALCALHRQWLQGFVQVLAPDARAESAERPAAGGMCRLKWHRSLPR